MAQRRIMTLKNSGAKHKGKLTFDNASISTGIVALNSSV